MTIMVAGTMKCIGTAQHLKQRFAQGFSALFKIRDLDDNDYVPEQALQEVKNEILRTFGTQYCVLKDEHKVKIFCICCQWRTCVFGVEFNTGGLICVCSVSELGFTVLPDKGRVFAVVGVIRTNGNVEE